MSYLQLSFLMATISMSGLSAPPSVQAAEVSATEMVGSFRRILGVTQNKGEIAIGTKCHLKYEIDPNNSISLNVTSSTGKQMFYHISHREKGQSVVGNGFSVTQQIGLDCETQGCISYSDIIFRLTSRELYIQDRSPYDSSSYSTIDSLSCPL
jgi:hypothetical protein